MKRVRWDPSTDTDSYQLVIDAQLVGAPDAVLFRDVDFKPQTAASIVVRSINAQGFTDSDPLIYSTKLPGKVATIRIEDVP